MVAGEERDWTVQKAKRCEWPGLIGQMGENNKCQFGASTPEFRGVLFRNGVSQIASCSWLSH